MLQEAALRQIEPSRAGDADAEDRVLGGGVFDVRRGSGQEHEAVVGGFGECRVDVLGRVPHAALVAAPETRAVAQRIEKEDPAGFTSNMGKANRKGKVFVDYLRNVRGANAVAAYSTRAKPGAPVSLPVDWDELDRLSSPMDFTVAEVPLRVLGAGSGRAADPWASYLGAKQQVPASLLRQLAG